MIRPSILVVEDNPLTLKMTSLALRSAEFQVWGVSTAQAALATLESNTPDLILLDLLLPDMDGLVLVQRIRALAHLSELPIIALTGLDSKVEVAKAMNLGFDHYLIKPVEPSRLIQTVQSFIPQSVSGKEEPGIGVKILLADDHAVLRKLLHIRLSQLGFEVTSVDDGSAALSKARQDHPHAIVSDILMPNLDGFGLCKAVRRDPDLAHIPVVLTSSAYIDEDDRRFATEIGASAFVVRTPGFQLVIEAIMASLRLPHPTPNPTVASSEQEVTTAHTDRVIRQLERQVALNETLTNASGIQQAQLSILASVAEVLMRSADTTAILEMVLSLCREASGYRMGAFYLLNSARSLMLHTHLGFSQSVAEEMEDFWGQLDFLYQSLAHGQLVQLPSPQASQSWVKSLLERTLARSVLIIPLVSGQRPLGVLVMGTDDEGSPEEALAFFKAVAGHISQALSLSKTMVELTAAEQHFRNIAESAAEGIIQTDATGIITYMNPAAETLFDYPVGGGLGEPITHLIPAIQGGQGRWESDGVAQDGHRIPLEGSTRSGPDNYGYLAYTHVLRDLTERRQHEAQLAYLVNYDSLTALFNRGRFTEEMERHLAWFGTRRTVSALLILGLDQFKSINEALGHQAGNMLLRSVANLLQHTFPEGSIFARLEGDTFAILLPLAEATEAEQHATRILVAIEDRIGWIDGELDHVTASAGIVLISGPDQSAELLLGQAETALHQAKVAGRNRYSVFQPGLIPNYQAQASLNWRHRISEALLNDRFKLLFQPICCVTDKQVNCYEVLIRLVEEDGRVIMPDEFLGIAERFGLIAEIDRWVVRRSIQTIADCQQRGCQLHLEVNLSARSLTDPHLLPMIQAELERTGVPAASLCFEITESAAITNLVEARRFISTLKAEGCYFALDDFGIGFSSFHYLKNLPVDIIKIDGSFIRDLANSETDQHLVRAIVGIARGLRRSTIAEFVGDSETLELLRSYGVNLGQGYYLGKPGDLPETLPATSNPWLSHL